MASQELSPEDKALLDKYTVYAKSAASFKDGTGGWLRTESVFVDGHQLLDACSSSMKLLWDPDGISRKSYSHEFDENTLKDIERILELLPESVKCNLGTARCRNDITALYAACTNPYIPVSTIKLMVEAGADHNRAIKLNGRWCPILKDIKENAPQGMGWCGTCGAGRRMKELEDYFSTLEPFVQKRPFESDDESE